MALTWIGADGKSVSQVDADAVAEFVALEQYFMAKGLPEWVARQCARDIDWTDDEFKRMIGL